MAVPKPKPVLTRGVAAKLRHLARRRHAVSEMRRRQLMDMEVSFHLIENMGFPKPKQQKIKKLAAHSVRLQGSFFEAEKGAPLTAKTAKKIIETTLKELPQYMRIKKITPEEERRHIQPVRGMFQTLFEIIKTEQDPNKPYFLSPETIHLAFAIHGAIVHQAVGNLFEEYTDIKDRALTLLARLEKKYGTR